MNDNVDSEADEKNNGSAGSSKDQSSLADSEQDMNNSDTYSDEHLEQVAELGAGNRRSMSELRPKRFVFRSSGLSRKCERMQQESMADSRSTETD